MSDAIAKLEKKEIIVKNTLQIIEHIESINYPRWTEYINRKIETFIFTVRNLYLLGDEDTARHMMHKITELEIIRDNPLVALGVEILSLDEIIKKTAFKYVGLVVAYEDTRLNAEFEIIDTKEKRYKSIEEAVRNNKGRSAFIIDFIPNFKKYSKIVASKYSKAIMKKDVYALLSSVMYFADFTDDEIKQTLKNNFSYTESVPPLNNLKYVAIVWGNENYFTHNQNQATLSIPCEEMSYNSDNGIYNIFFSIGGTGKKDVVQYSDAYFEKTRYDNFSQIYSTNFNGVDCYPYCIDEYYAIFA